MRRESPIRFEGIYFLPNLLYPIHALRSLEFFPEPFPKPCIIKPYTNHHYHKYHAGAKVIHGYSSFLILIYNPALSTGPARR